MGAAPRGPQPFSPPPGRRQRGGVRGIYFCTHVYTQRSPSVLSCPCSVCPGQSPPPRPPLASISLQHRVEEGDGAEVGGFIGPGGPAPPAHTPMSSGPCALDARKPLHPLIPTSEGFGARSGGTQGYVGPPLNPPPPPRVHTPPLPHRRPPHAMGTVLGTAPLWTPLGPRGPLAQQAPPWPLLFPQDPPPKKKKKLGGGGTRPYLTCSAAWDEQ